ncbi:MAG TPA: class I SAM-dependent methyltransferase [Verrucomicrobiae bacterium]|nr:class I SAM-dependent methyltransferase [Verrucomicrobiae bacterium]
MNPDLEIWDNAADAWASAITKPGTLRSIHFKKVIDQLLSEVSNKKILDAGCGDGVFTKYLANQNASVIGVDGSQEMIKIAKAKFPELDFAVTDLLQPMSFPDKSFDFVLANMVLMHLSDIKMFLKESKRVLKQNGTLIFSVLHPCFNFPTMKLYKSFMDKLLNRRPSGLAFDYFQTHQTRRFETNMNRELTHYHRTLEQYSKDLNANGFSIELMLEPHELDSEFLRQKPRLEYTTRLPRFLFIKAKSI